MNTLRDIYQDGLFAHNLFSFLDRPIDVVAAGTKPFPAPLREGIRFENVWFKYPGSDEWVLQDISFHVRPGEKISLVGRNGSGKTTLIKLLMGMHRPHRGRILFDNVPLQAISEDELRKHMSAIFQDFVKFGLTLRESIAFGDVTQMEDEQRVAEAAATSGADQIAASLRDGYETILSKAFGGTDLSGGQWQKIALARGLMRDAEILFLDEPTASFDPRAEVAVFERFKRLAYGRTAFLISHRIGTARLADRIFLLQDGRLIATGQHEELLRQGGEYADLFELQAQWYSDAAADAGA